MSFQERHLEGVPAALRADREKHTPIRAITDRRPRGHRASGLRGKTETRTEQRVEMILHEHLELPMHRHRRQPCVARLLHPFDEQRTIAALVQNMRIEVMPFHALGIRQDDLPDTQRGELSPQAPHHFRTGKGEQHIHLWPGRFNLLCDSVVGALASPREEQKFTDILNKFAMKPKVDWVHEKLRTLQDAKPRLTGLPENAAVMVTVIYDLIRAQRNDLGHPRDVPPNLPADDVNANLLIFPKYYETAERVRAFLGSTKV